MDISIFYAAEAYQTRQPKLMGRNAAGEAFMRAWLRHGGQQHYSARVPNAQQGEAFAADVRAAQPQATAEAITALRLARLEQTGLLYYPGPDIAQNAWERAAHGHAAWSLCGITHTTASHAAMDAITSWTTAPVMPWDAVICTSGAVLATVKAVLEAQAAHLAQRLGAQRLTLPMLPVIPLGVHSDNFDFSDAERASARQALGLEEGDVVVLYVGRLSFHAKAHPAAMYQALQLAQARLDKSPGGPGAPRLVLLECGWHANEAIASAYAEAAQLLMPGIRQHLVDGREATSRRQAWAAADIFCSLSDNVQETFGLTPIEAMAAGLPAVVSDWNGYRDTVRDGLDGYRIPTWAPPPGDAQDLATSHALGTLNYDHYCGHLGASAAVDIGACVAAIEALARDPSLRRRLGAQAQQRVHDEFEWRVVFRRYQALWQAQTERRLEARPKLQALPHPWPARMDPSVAFASYPTHSLAPETLLGLAQPISEALRRLQELSSLAMVQPFAGNASTLALARRLLECCAQAACPLHTLEHSVSDLGSAVQVRRRVAWLCKFGLLQAVRATP
jgi:alpha-maltose-1-phosphate synthase